MAVAVQSTCAEFRSRFMILEPGNVIATGTPPGIGFGMKPPVYLKAGDTMRLGIEGLSVQRSKVAKTRS